MTRQSPRLFGTGAQRQIEYKIDGVPGLSLVLKPKGKLKSVGTATFYVRYQVGSGAKDRTERRVAIGQYRAGVFTLHDARTKALSIMSEVANGRDPVEAVRAEATKAKAREEALTLRQLFELRVEKDAKRSARTMEDYKQILEADVFPDLGDLPANEIDADQIVEVLERIEARSKNAAHKARSALGSTFRWGMTRRKVKQNPVNGLGFIHKSERRAITVSDKQIKSLWLAFEDDEFGATEPTRLILKLALLTGQRNSEVAGAEKSELRLDGLNPRWTIPARRMKRKDEDQLIPLSQQACELFRHAIELSGDKTFVFPGTTHGRRIGHEWRQGHIGQESVSRAMAKARELAGLDAVRLHDLRKVLTTWLAERLEHPAVLDRILHHARAGVTGTHYDFSTLEGPLRQALQRWADHVFAVIDQGGAAANVVEMKRA